MRNEVRFGKWFWLFSHGQFEEGGSVSVSRLSPSFAGALVWIDGVVDFPADHSTEQ